MISPQLTLVKPVFAMISPVDLSLLKILAPPLTPLTANVHRLKASSYEHSSSMSHLFRLLLGIFTTPIFLSARRRRR